MPSRIAVAVAAATCAALSVGTMAGAVGAPNSPAISHKPQSGNSEVAFNADTLKALKKDHFTLTATGRATLKTAHKVTTLKFPLTGGTYYKTKGTIVTTGGLKITHGSRSITISNVVLNPAKHYAKADVTKHGKVDALVLGDPNSGNGGPTFVQFGSYDVSLSSDLIKLLDAKFATKIFKKNPDLGLGESTVSYK